MEKGRRGRGGGEKKSRRERDYLSIPNSTFLLSPLSTGSFRFRLSVSHPYSRLGSSISASIENSFHPSDPMANLPFHLIRDADWDILFADSQSEDLTKTFQVRKLTCSGKEEPKWQLTALAWLSGGGIHLRKRLRFYEIDLVVDGTRSDIFFIPSSRSCTLRGLPVIFTRRQVDHESLPSWETCETADRFAKKGRANSTCRVTDFLPALDEIQNYLFTSLSKILGAWT